MPRADRPKAIPKGWRKLKAGELLKPGDKYSNKYRFWEWSRSYNADFGVGRRSGDMLGNIYIRRRAKARGKKR